MEVPALTPVINPVVLLIVATAVLLLVHTPPVVLFVNCVVLFTQTVLVPVIPCKPGDDCTVNWVVAFLIQPAALVTV